ncbi:GNAT family N-acetyltransferase [Actinoplanes derwentensis]|uniref:Acetyltransferase (GNAT) domain-containing protein n=1 Tax=Actinoplanes derwentensis TaxID=113562 RepID=A0A1H1PIN1_9ACTN|nr:GNAT family N-acetyltransferase [Actinoplanes derwentensis]GID84911.1 N-acetyltransferase [Actinoplanes derwentensis]SDS11161.1 Acetyltransferase (GNAT) domain-containing protein [Actinoplanes derwentensis]
MTEINVTVRRASEVDAPALAGLRWKRATQDHGYQGDDLDEFVEVFGDWMRGHPEHRAFVAEVGGEVVGMAWLAVLDRVPTVTGHARRGGDVQSVFVVPELRDRRVGALLMAAVLDEARGLELEHVTVHSSPRAVPFYERNGWGHDPEWLSWAGES